ncbi:hypothetical protein A3A84_00205 [Candidatus Collierbacteria bacterium RIFCSPLOWO2_01_FULL_50_23]|nr:MAG: hypothetical protein A3A84_00205 [Candidatus Collierbacteria bacterium RIFCSPLOWO2_01_FULL_50_23]
MRSALHGGLTASRARLVDPQNGDRKEKIMLGAFAVLVYLVLKWLFMAPLAPAAIWALGFLLRWYIMCSALGAIYGTFTVAAATVKSDYCGCLATIGVLVFNIFFTAIVWVVHYGSLIWGTYIMIGLTTSFGWWDLVGGGALIFLGCIVQLVELIAIFGSSD